MSRMLLSSSPLPWRLLLAVALMTGGCRSGASTGESIAPPMTSIPVGAADATGADYAPPPPGPARPGHTPIDPDGAPGDPLRPPTPPGANPGPDLPDELQSPFDPPPALPEPPVPPGTDL